MVGARFIYALTGKLSTEALQTDALGSSCPGLQSWERQTVWQNDKFSLGFAKYPAYPITLYETQEFSLFLEGRLYGLSSAQTQTELLKLAQLVTAPGGPSPSLERWLRDTDGDFLIFMFHKNTNTIFIINDSFARLPVYYHGDGRTLTLSRDLGFILDNSRKTAFDPLALTQYLLFGFPLGKRTLFAGIFALPPATLITLAGQGAGLRFATIFHHNLEELPASSPSIAVNTENLVDRFRAACLNRASLTGENVVSLSGGLDSRAVAACLHQAKIPLAAASFLDHEGVMHKDVQVARQVAAHLNLPWRTFQLPPPRQKEVNTLLHLKEGANNLEMSFILPFFAGLLKTFGPALTYFTGDGGGDTLGESRPYRHLPSLDALLGYLIESYQIFPLEVTASLTGVPAADLVDSLAGLVQSFPESTPAKKYQHFFCLEVAQKEYNEGEDRNRHYFWSVSPFYAFPFFEYALG
ncbi:MAG: asparagine synthase-related protein, partial [Desulfobaccales bacterium]